MNSKFLSPKLASMLVVAGLMATPVALQAQTNGSGAQHQVAANAIVEVVAEDYAFDAPDAIRSGWTTLRFRNQGKEPHMVYMARLPEGTSFDDYETEAQVPFNRIWTAVKEGKVDLEGAFAMVGEVLPAWYPAVGLVGGPGFVAPGVASDVTVYLEPGTYAIECYMKTEDGKVHYMEGMSRPLTVTAEASTASEPAPDVRITLSNFAMTVEGDLTPGKRIVAVHVTENPEAGFGHSVHLARLNPGTDVQDVVHWMNWFDIAGLRTPAPARFIGGMHPMPAGRTAYFTVDLEPGRYVALSEATGAQGVLKEFTVK